MDEKRAIVDAYAQIHARGVLHGDVALRHMLIGTLRFQLSSLSFSPGSMQAGMEGQQLSISDGHLAFNRP
jgi:hypothetical protein